MSDTRTTLNNIDKTINAACEYAQQVTTSYKERNVIPDNDYYNMLNSIATLVEARSNWAPSVISIRIKDR